MTDLWFFAFIVMPAVIASCGYGALLLHRRSLDRQRRTPAE